LPIKSKRGRKRKDEQLAMERKYEDNDIEDPEKEQRKLFRTI